MPPTRPEQATAEFQAAVKASPRQPEAHFGLGYLYWKQKRFEEARREFQAELANQPQHTQALTYLGDAEMHAGDEKAAEQHLRAALKLDANIRLAHLDLGIILANMNDPTAPRVTFARPSASIRPSRTPTTASAGCGVLSAASRKHSPSSPR